LAVRCKPDYAASISNLVHEHTAVVNTSVYVCESSQVCRFWAWACMVYGRIFVVEGTWQVSWLVHFITAAAAD
jgi:hypothetical protein